MKKGSVIGFVGIFLMLVIVGAPFFTSRQTPAISNQVVVTAIGLQREGEMYQLSIQSIEALKTSASLSEQSDNATAVYRAQGESVAGALRAFLNETGRSTYILHNQVIALEENIARDRSVFETMDYFIRNLEGRSLVNLVICRGDPASLLGIQSGNDAIPAEYVAQLLEEGARLGLTPTSRLLDVQRAFGGMCDLMVPIIAVEDKTPRLDGTMVFKDGFSAGELNAEETTALLFAGDRIDSCLYTVEGITFRIKRSRTDVTIRENEEAFRYAFHISASADIVESEALSPEDSEKDRALQLLEEKIAAAVKRTVETVVWDFGSDPLALARRTAMQYKTLAQQEAARKLVDSSFEVTAEIRLSESGFSK